MIVLKGDISERISILKEQVNEADIRSERELADAIYERLSKLQGGVGVIRIGASSATEMKETKERVDDALNTTRFVIKEGVVVGGGLTLLKLSSSIDELPMR